MCIFLIQKSTSLSLDGLSFIKDPSFGDILRTFRNLTTLRYYDCLIEYDWQMKNLEILRVWVTL